MIKNVLKGVAVVLAVSEISVLWFVLTLAEPSGRLPGGRLSGEEVTGRVTDWSFTRDGLELHTGQPPAYPGGTTLQSLFRQHLFFCSRGKPLCVLHTRRRQPLGPVFD